MSKLFIILTLFLGSPLYCHAVDDIQTGPNGTPGAPGTAGGSATATAVSSDPSNLAAATGGNGGSSTSGPQGAGGDATATAQSTGGNASSATATAVGGNSGSFALPSTAVGGDGGDATAVASASGAGPTLTVTASATGGNAGEVLQSTMNAPGGMAGGAFASAIGNLTSTGMLVVTATARAGNGGLGVGSGSGANGGSPAFGPVFGSSLGDATISAFGYGGNGGWGTYRGMGAPGAAGDVVMNNVVSGSASGRLTLSQTAVAGNGGGARNLPSAGGSATSILQFTATAPTAFLELRSTATGGSGGDGWLPGDVGAASGAAGSATATSDAFNPFGTAGASSSASSGIVSSAVGDGGALPISAAVAQATARGLGASAEARSWGEDGAFGLISPLHGGLASSTASAISLSTLPAVSLAVASNSTGDNSDPRFRPNGGNSVASASSVGLGEVNASASSRGGGGYREARAGDALATATGTGTSGSVRVAATTFLNSSLPGRGFAAVTASGWASVNGTSTAQAQVRFEAAASSPGDLLTRQVTSEVIGRPLAGDVSAALAGNTAASAVFDPASTDRNFTLASLGGGRGATVTLRLDTQFGQIQNFELPGEHRLQLALLNPQASGAGFDSLRLQILVSGLVGSAYLDQTFADLATARAYFSDHLLDLGQVEPMDYFEVSVTLDIVTSRPEDAFGATFFLGAAVVPEPATWLILVAGGLVGVILRQRRAQLPC